jgi:hypothetical protein
MSLPQKVTITEGPGNWQFPAVTIPKLSLRSTIPAIEAAQKTSIDPPGKLHSAPDALRYSPQK